jgi:hypothetical protein
MVGARRFNAEAAMGKDGGGVHKRFEGEFVYRTGYGGFASASEWKRRGEKYAFDACVQR